MSNLFMLQSNIFVRRLQNMFKMFLLWFNNCFTYITISFVTAHLSTWREMDSIFLLCCCHKIEIPVAKIVMRTLLSRILDRR